MPDVYLLLSALLALFAIGCFTVMFGIAIWRTWFATGAAPVFGEPYMYVATALAGLVGGIVASGFHQKLPDATPLPESVQVHIESVGHLVLPSQPIVYQQSLGATYAVAYVVLGLVAIVTWLVRSKVTPDVVKNLASISFGLMLAIVRAFLA